MTLQELSKKLIESNNQNIGKCRVSNFNGFSGNIDTSTINLAMKSLVLNHGSLNCYAWEWSIDVNRWINKGKATENDIEQFVQALGY